MKLSEPVRAIAFDADDTLWDLQSNFDAVEQDYCKLLSDFGTSDELSKQLFHTETANMPILGYGCKAFTISLVENALKVSKGTISPATIGEIVRLGKSLLTLDVPPLPEVATTLQLLHDSQRYQLVVFTKGELLDQQNKLRRSGLYPLFHHVSIVSEKDENAYRELCASLQLPPSEVVMVGNSFKSDIAPALSVGCQAVHIPFHTIWRHEHMDEFSHPRLFCITHFGQLAELLDITSLSNK